MLLYPSNNEEICLGIREASPAHLLLKIESFSLLSENGIEEYESRVFVAGGHKWKLIIYPDGDSIGKGGDHISVHLSMIGTNSLPMDWVVNATVTVFLLNQIQDKYVCFGGKAWRFHAMNAKCRFSKLLSKKTLTDPSNGFLIDDNCVLGAEVSFVQGQRVTECVSVKVRDTFKKKLVIPNFSKLKDVWNSEEFVAGDYRWKIKLFPEGLLSGKGHYVSIFLACVGFAAHEKVMAEFSISIINENHDKHYTKILSNWFSTSADDWGLYKFIPIGDMRDPGKGFVVYDSCSLETEISIKAVVRDATK